ncbi:SusC/RagA family TonB-linked outer membrane protein [Portibacter lacus]|uniref:SusC/RagA family TonB-linked outer membrane protein n=1 Tax=Portibacter lacus TaxID=1099794 RepID=A0AA37SLU7_9BACT|nr:TonB-dependent receptor [Portibacter lacus]GLR16883.1 SusC/RagA family TonB-linked outer membrane protein [Portibacter lacus]
MKKQIRFNRKSAFIVIAMTFFTFAMEIISAAPLAEFTISGKVLDADTGEPLIGASVQLKGSVDGVITDVDGTFNISLSKSDGKLLIAYLGYETVEIDILPGQEFYNIQLVESSTKLDEVVVIGYGTQKKANLSGAVDQVALEQIENRPVTTLSSSLQGLIPNLNVDFASGKPGSNANLNIRGFTSINGGEPLIVLDGIPIENNELNYLNPNDISSISVLKDASSSAIYGARASFGVILITTKNKGTGISYTTNVSFSRPTVLPDPITDPYIFSRLLELSTNNTPWDYVNYSDEHYKWAKERSDNSALPEVRPNPNDPSQWAYMGDNNWNDYFFDNYSVSQNHNISFQGSSDKINYFISCNYSKDNGNIKITDDPWSRYNARIKFGFNPSEWLNIETNSSFLQVNQNGPSYNISQSFDLVPLDVVKNPDGSWANTTAGRLAARITEGGRSETNTTGFQSTVRANLSLSKALSITADATYKRYADNNHTDYRKYYIGYGPNDIREESQNTPSVTESSAYNNYNAYNIFATYNKNIGNDQLVVIGGYNQEYSQYDYNAASRNGLISSSLPYVNLASGDQFVSGDFYDWATRGFFGRINYILNNKYILEVNGRYDGSSRFSENDRWGFFPSISGAWILSEENFMSGISPVVETLKLRASYGALGNQATDSYYGYILNLPSYLTGYLINGDVQRVVGAPGLNVDPDNYTWERVNSMNLGIDLGLYKNKIYGTFDYYTRNTLGMLTGGKELPSVLGTSVPQENAADLQTKGWELGLKFQNSYGSSRNPLQIELGFNLSDNQTVITRFENEEALFSSYRVGQSIGEIWGLENDGLFQSEEEIEALDQTAIIPWGALSVVPGWPKFVDQDGDGAILQGNSAKDPKDLSVIGNSQARFRYGMNMNVSWSGFDFSVLMQGVAKRDYYPIHYLYWGPYQQPYANTYDHLLNFYRPETDSPEDMAKHSQAYIDMGLANANVENPDYPILQAWLADYRENKGLAIPQTKYLLNAAYLRVKNLTLGYTLKNDRMKAIGVTNVRVYFTGENLFEFSQLKDYFDPESINTWGGYAYPFQRRYAVGLNLKF